jgi:hypothetical protein
VRCQGRNTCGTRVGPHIGFEPFRPRQHRVVRCCSSPFASSSRSFDSCVMTPRTDQSCRATSALTLADRKARLCSTRTVPGATSGSSLPTVASGRGCRNRRQTREPWSAMPAASDCRRTASQMVCPVPFCCKTRSTLLLHMRCVVPDRILVPISFMRGIAFLKTAPKRNYIFASVRASPPRRPSRDFCTRLSANPGLVQRENLRPGIWRT